MKTLCLILNRQDQDWLIDYYQKHHLKEEIAIIAPNFEAQYLLSKLNLPYKSYEELAWNLDYNHLYNTARDKSYSWQFIEELHQEKLLNDISSYHGYPLLTMLQPNLMLPLYEVLQARAFIYQIFDKECPDKIVLGKRQNPFDEEFNRYFILTGSNGLESECAIQIAKEKNIEIIENTNKPKTIIRKQSILKGITNFGRKTYKAFTQPQLISKEISKVVQRYSYYKSLQVQHKQLKFINENNTEKPKILMFAWGGYYLEYFANIIDSLGDLAHFVVVIIGEDDYESTLRFIKELRKKGAYVFSKSSWEVSEAREIIDHWVDKVKETIIKLKNNEVLANYFIDEYGSYYDSFALPIFEKELLYTIPKTVLNIQCAELIYETIRPDLVISHFSIYPSEACDVLPARKLGIPTVTLEHGITATTESVRDSLFY